MQHLTVQRKLQDLGGALPSKDRFWKAGDLTALRQDEAGRFYRSNYERGFLLYALAAALRPKVVLEFGTGRGYGALCSAWALVDHGIDGMVYSIDVRRYGERRSWWIDYGSGPEVRELSWSEVWPSHFERAWLDRIRLLTGTSWEVMLDWKRRRLPRVDFAFIDGGHDDETVKHDYYSLLEVAQPSISILFDDYNDRADFGVRKLVDEEVSADFDCEMVSYAPRDGGAITTTTDVTGAGMILATGRRATVAAATEHRRRFLADYAARQRMSRRLRPLRSFLRPIVKAMRLR